MFHRKLPHIILIFLLHLLPRHQGLLDNPPDAESDKLLIAAMTSPGTMRNILGIGLLPGRRLLLILDELFFIPRRENLKTQPDNCCHPEDYYVFDTVQSAEGEDNLEERVFYLEGAVALSSKWPALYQILSSKFTSKQARFFFVTDNGDVPYLLLYSYYYDDVGQPMYAMALAGDGANSVTPVEPGWWAVPGAPYGPFFQYQAPVSTSGAYFYTMNSVQNTVVRQLLSRVDKYEVQDGDLPTSGVQDVASYHVCINAKQTYAKVVPWDAHGYQHSSCPPWTGGIGAPYMTAFEDTSGYYFFDHWNNYTWRMDRQTFNGSLGPFTYLNTTNLADLFVYGRAPTPPTPKPTPKHTSSTQEFPQTFGTTPGGRNVRTNRVIRHRIAGTPDAIETRWKIICIVTSVLILLIIGVIALFLIFCRKANAKEERLKTPKGTGKGDKGSKEILKQPEKEGGADAGKVSGASPTEQGSPRFLSLGGKAASFAKKPSKDSKQGKSSNSPKGKASGESVKSSKLLAKKKRSGKSSRKKPSRKKSSRKSISKRRSSAKRSRKTVAVESVTKSNQSKLAKRKNKKTK